MSSGVRPGLTRVRQRWLVARSLKGVLSVGRNPVVQGRPRLDAGALVIGDDVLLWDHNGNTRLTGHGRIEIGDRVFVNEGAIVHASNLVRIGDDVALGLGCYVADSHQHGIGTAPVRHEVTIIGDGVWIGAHAHVLAGVTVGRRSIVAAGAVVTRDVPPDTLVAGVPARFVKTLAHPDDCTSSWNNRWEPSHWRDGGHLPWP